MKLITWNMAHRGEAWRYLLNSDADLALLQEAAAPPVDVSTDIEVDSAPWETAGAGAKRQWRTAIANLSNQYELHWFQPKSIDTANFGELAVSRPGTLAAAALTLPTGEDLIVISIYGAWERPDSSTGSGWIFADASVHRVADAEVGVLTGQIAARVEVPALGDVLDALAERGVGRGRAVQRDLLDDAVGSDAQREHQRALEHRR